MSRHDHAVFDMRGHIDAVAARREGVAVAEATYATLMKLRAGPAA